MEQKLESYSDYLRSAILNVIALKNKSDQTKNLLLGQNGNVPKIKRRKEIGLVLSDLITKNNKEDGNYGLADFGITQSVGSYTSSNFKKLGLGNTYDTARNFTKNFFGQRTSGGKKTRKHRRK